MHIVTNKTTNTAFSFKSNSSIRICVFTQQKTNNLITTHTQQNKNKANKHLNTQYIYKNKNNIKSINKTKHNTPTQQHNASINKTKKNKTSSTN